MSAGLFITALLRLLIQHSGSVGALALRAGGPASSRCSGIIISLRNLRRGLFVVPFRGCVPRTGAWGSPDQEECQEIQNTPIHTSCFSLQLY